MAEIDFDESYQGEPASLSGIVQTGISVLGALLSLGLVIGVGLWGYRLAMRDVSGVPVIRALAGPMRIAPEDPGGQIAANQGLSVNTVAASGAADNAPERVVLAPRDVRLAAEDTAPADAPPVVAPTRVTPNLDTAGPERVASADTGPLDVGGDAAAVPLSAPAGPGLATSPVPRPRPASVPASAPAAAAAAPAEIDPASLPAGTRLVQLGAFDDPETARAEWAKLSQKFDGLMHGKSRVIQQAASGGRTFYRLRAAGFEDEADARSFCAALLAEDAACIPVLLR